MDFNVVEHETFTLVEFQIPGGTLAPSDLGTVKAPSVPGHLGVVLSGRGPVWLYGYLVHEYHPTAWVACHDPRLGGAVVVERHSGSAPRLGEVVPIPKA